MFNRQSKLIIVATATIVLVAVWLMQNASNNPDQTAQPSHKSHTASVENAADSLLKEHDSPLQPNSPSQPNGQSALQQQLATLYSATLPDGHQPQQMHLDENWCIASADLKVEAYEEYLAQLDAWELSRGNITLHDPTYEALGGEQARRNSDFIAPYEDLPPNALLQHAGNNDLVALSVITQRNDFKLHIKTKAANQLLLLGDTSKGLTRLVINELAQMKPLKSDNSNQQDIRNRFVKALAMVRYGLQRKDTSALQTFLIYAQQPTRFLQGAAPQDFIQPDDYRSITKTSNKMIRDINLAREQVNIAPIEIGNESNVAEMHFQDKMVFLMNQYKDTLSQAWFPPEWQREFIPDTPCMQRKVATHRFWREQVPALQAELKTDSEKPELKTKN